jgi:hypothetical protein
MVITANHVKPGMRVRPMSPRGGWQWAKVVKSQRQGFLINICVEWVAGGSHVWCVPAHTRFRYSNEY